jgi:hypothetical protein
MREVFGRLATKYAACSIKHVKQAYRRSKVQKRHEKREKGT